MGTTSASVRSPDGAKRNAGGSVPDCGAARIYPGYKSRRGERRSCAASLLRFLRLERLRARRRGGVGLAHRDAIGQAQVDQRDVARQKLLVAIERDQAVERLG